MRRIAEIWRRLGLPRQLAATALLAALLFAPVFFALRGGAREAFDPNSNGGTPPFILVQDEDGREPPSLPEIAFPDWDDFAPEQFDGRPRSLLTGLPADEETLARRPVAVVINNQFGAHPQSGVAHADIVYQVLAEGATTRLVAVFQSEIPEKIGPIRSARDYFVDFAFNHDAFFVHHGGSPSGNERVRNLLGRDAADGMRLEGTVFWRDRSFPAWAGIDGQRMLEHSSYTGWERLRAHIEAAGARASFGHEQGFAFGSVPPGREARVVTVPFSAQHTTVFVFDETTGDYLVEHPRGAWMDEYSVSQARVANVLIQHVQMRVVDAEGRRAVDTVGRGSGYLARGGYVYNVFWEKSGHTSPMRWYFEDGSPIVLAPGRTWVNVLQSNAEPLFAGPPVTPEMERGRPHVA